MPDVDATLHFSCRQILCVCGCVGVHVCWLKGQTTLNATIGNLSFFSSAQKPTTTTDDKLHKKRSGRKIEKQKKKSLLKSGKSFPPCMKWIIDVLCVRGYTFSFSNISCALLALSLPPPFTPQHKGERKEQKKWGGEYEEM